MQSDECYGRLLYGALTEEKALTSVDVRNNVSAGEVHGDTELYALLGVITHGKMAYESRNDKGALTKTYS